MTDKELLIEGLERRAEKLRDRRQFFRTAGGVAAAGVVGAAMLGNAGPVAAQAVSDPDILNFALNLEYLEAQFYQFAAFNIGLPAPQTSGTGTQGGVTGGRQVNFSDPVVRQYAIEIAQDEAQHVAFLRSQLGASAVAQPALDIGGTDPNGAFSSAARAAGLVGPGQAFDPYASDENFLLAAFIFEDVGVTAYKGAAPLITNKTYLEAAAGILAVEAYHAAIVRTALYSKGIATPSLRTSADKISDARDSLDGPSDLDQGISGTSTTSNIVPTDGNGITFSRSTGQVLNIVYLNPGAVRRGGFFPNGVNGNIILSAASG